jgi:hypothetical protein
MNNSFLNKKNIIPQLNNYSNKENDGILSQCRNEPVGGNNININNGGIGGGGGSSSSNNLEQLKGI